MREADGFQWIDEGADNHLTFLDHEPFMLPLLKSYLRPGGIFVDVGAHFGRYTVRLSELARLVYAFEPHPGNRHVLNQHLELNAINNVVVVPFGADATWRAGNITDEGASSRFAYKTEDNTIPILTCPLDILPTADLIKIDVEGHEGSVLKGGRALLRRSQPVMVIEIHPGDARPQVEKFLTEEKYGWETVGQSGKQEYWLCQPET